MSKALRSVLGVASYGHSIMDLYREHLDEENDYSYIHLVQINFIASFHYACSLNKPNSPAV